MPRYQYDEIYIYLFIFNLLSYIFKYNIIYFLPFQINKLKYLTYWPTTLCIEKMYMFVCRQKPIITQYSGIIV